MNLNLMSAGLLLALTISACGASEKKQAQGNQENTHRIEQQTLQTDSSSTQFGTNFQELTLEQASQKAKEQGKLIFVDCYIKSCVPCKKMLKTIFPQKICGDYFNANYICITMDLEEPGDGIETSKKYNVKIYPTFLVLKPDGTKIFEEVGATFDAEKFVEKIKAGVSQAK